VRAAAQSASATHGRDSGAHPATPRLNFSDQMGVCVYMSSGVLCVHVRTVQWGSSSLIGPGRSLVAAVAVQL
jgi:hypothetical protein